jgi:hypothetical protein
MARQFGKHCEDRTGKRNPIRHIRKTKSSNKQKQNA